MKVIRLEDICEEHNTRLLSLGGRKFCQQCVEISKNITIAAQDKKLLDLLEKKRRFAANLPLRHANCNFKNYILDHSEQKAVFEKVVSYYKAAYEQSTGNLILAGTTGTGKTHLACALINNFLNHKRNVEYITSSSLAQRLMDSWDKSLLDINETIVIKNLTKLDFLIIDEYGLHDRDNKKELVHKVLLSRLDSGKPVILISNLPFESLIPDLGDRLWSRLHESGLEILSFVWEDYRIKAENKLAKE